MDRKDKNLLKFIVSRFVVPSLILFLLCFYTQLYHDPVRLVGYFTIAYICLKIFIKIQKALEKPRKPREYGEWAIVTGATSGIGKAFAHELAGKKMNILIISRVEEKLKEVQSEIEKYGVKCRYITHNFENYPAPDFELELTRVCQELHENGGIGILVNNVGVANEIPELFHLVDKNETHKMVTVNIFGTLRMTNIVIPFMMERNIGSIISVSSASCLHATPMLSVYSATKAFMEQFSRSLHYEYKEHGIDIMCITPYYVVSNMFKRVKATLIAPSADRVAHETLSYLGRRVEVYPYWMHRVIGEGSRFVPSIGNKLLTIMKRNRARALKQSKKD